MSSCVDGGESGVALKIQKQAGTLTQVGRGGGMMILFVKTQFYETEDEFAGPSGRPV